MSDDLTLTATLTRTGGPGGEWTAFLDNGDPAVPGARFGPASSPGELLELVGQAVDAGETEAIINARRSSPDDTE